MRVSLALQEQGRPRPGEPAVLRDLKSRAAGAWQSGGGVGWDHTGVMLRIFHFVPRAVGSHQNVLSRKVA